MKKKARVQRNLTLIYWKGKKYWLGKLLENPEIMTQGKRVQELIENIKDAYEGNPASEVLMQFMNIRTTKNHKGSFCRENNRGVCRFSLRSDRR